MALNIESSADILHPKTSEEILSNALASTENYLLRRTPQPFAEKFIGYLRRRDPLQERQERLIAASQRECETASVHFLTSVLPDISHFPVAALLKSRNAMHDDAPAQWSWHTAVILSDGDKWHLVSPANYSKDTPGKKIISDGNLQHALDAFSQQEFCDWPSASYIQEQLPQYEPPHVERVKTEKGFTLPYLRSQMYTQDGDTPQTTSARLLRGM